MNITVKGEFAAEVLLGKEELEDMGISFEDMDYANAETRRFLWTLVDEIRRKTTLDINFSGKLLIEVVKESKGRVRICFTSLSGNEEDPKSVKQLVKSENVPLIAEFNNFEALLTAAYLLENRCESQLFVKNGVCRLVLHGEKPQKIRLSSILCEFGECTGNYAYEYSVCREMWDCVIPSGATEILSSVFSMKQ